jgi:uncharacterized protein (TIGR02246 family)
MYELSNAFVSAFNDGDIDRWMDLWDENSIQMPAGHPRRIGKKQIRAGSQAWFERSGSTIQIHLDEVSICDDRAYAHGTYEFKYSGNGRGLTSQTGSFLDILQKQADGSWKILVHCHNTIQ